MTDQPVDDAGTAVKIDPSANAVKIDKTGNAVKLDPSANAVKLDADGNTVHVASLPPVTGAVEVTRIPPVEIVKMPPVQAAPLPDVLVVRPDEPMPVHVLSSPAGVRGMAWAVTAVGGRCGFHATIGSFDIAQALTPEGLAPVPAHRTPADNPAPAVVAVFVNPADSGVDIYVDRFVVGSNRPGEWTRLRGPQVSIHGEPIREINRGGGERRAAAQLYTGAAASARGGQLSKVIYTGQAESRNEEVRGTIVLRPGDAWSFVYDAVSGAYVRVTVEIMWWEVPAED